MGLSPANIAALQTIDQVAPGEPTIGLGKQIGNDSILARVQLPTHDHGGGPLSRLAALAVVSAPGAGIFDCLSPQEILALPPGAQLHRQIKKLTPANTGEVVGLTVPVLALGEIQSIAAICSDEPLA